MTRGKAVVSSKPSDIHYVGTFKFRVERVKRRGQPAKFHAIVKGPEYWHTIATGSLEAEVVKEATDKLTAFIGEGGGGDIPSLILKTPAPLVP